MANEMNKSAKIVPPSVFVVDHVAIIETDVPLMLYQLVANGNIMYTQSDVPPGKHQVPTSCMVGHYLGCSMIELIVYHQTDENLFETGHVRFQTYPLGDRPSQFRGLCVQNQYSTFAESSTHLLFNGPVLRIDVRRKGSTACGLRLSRQSETTIELQSVADEGVTTFLFPDPINFSCMDNVALVVTGGDGNVHVTAQSLSKIDLKQ